MSTIHLDFSQKGVPSRQFILHSTQSSPVDGLGDQLNFTATRTLYRDNPRVYRGNLCSADGRGLTDVSCKMMFGNIAPLEAEAKLYQTALQDAQGSFVPRFLGYFSGISSYTQNPIACLITKYAGEHIRCSSWFDVPIVIRCALLSQPACVMLIQVPYYRGRIFKVLGALHEFHIYHENFSPRHVVVDEQGWPKIVDFEKATLHDCTVTKLQFELYDIQPAPGEIDCPELWETSLAMDVWTPRKSHLRASLPSHSYPSQC